MEFKKNVFIVMPFGKDNTAYQNANAAYENVVKPLCEELELEVIRADDIVSTCVVYNDIMQGVCNSDIVIVDISGRNPNVMYELGIAHALRQQTTIIITQDNVTESPFDIAHFRIIPYENSMKGSNDLRDKLRKTISTVLQGNIALQREFEYCFTLFDAIGKKNDLILLVGLHNCKEPVGMRDNRSVLCWQIKYNNRDAGFSSSSDAVFNPLFRLQCVTKNGDTISLTEKGKVFAEYLIKKGYSCELSPDNSKMVEWLQNMYNPTQQQ